MTGVYRADSSLKGKLRRRLARLAYRRPAAAPKHAMVTFSFDDAPASAAEVGAKLLEKHGLRGVYYISAGMMGRDTASMGPMADGDTVRRLAASGHEIACHTLSHLDCGVSDDRTIQSDVEANRLALVQLGVQEPVSFAFPYGDVSPGAKKVLGGRFLSLRGLHHGLVEAGSDLNQAPAVGIEGEDGESLGLKWLEAAKRQGGWLILYTHDVQENPSPFGCTPAVLERLIDKALALDLDVVTAAQGVERLSQTSRSLRAA